MKCNPIFIGEVEENNNKMEGNIYQARDSRAADYVVEIGVSGSRRVIAEESLELFEYLL
jgi:hypothetical protein